MNVARPIAPLDDPRMAGFTDNIERINALGAAAPGFVWIMASDDDAVGNTDAHLFGDPDLVTNVTMWEDLDSLMAFTLRSEHADFLRRRREWFVPTREANLALWWVAPTHRPDLAECEERLQHLRVHGPTEFAFTPRSPFPPPTGARVEVVPYDPAWPQRYEREAERIRDALGDRVVALHHTGSTSVSGLAAKPIIDIVLVVADTDDEAAYVPALESVGYRLHLREPDWCRHRVLKPRDAADVNLHVFPPECEEVARMLAFRDHLRRDADDRAEYEATKLRLAEGDWDTVQDYADAKTDVVREILARAGWRGG